MVCLKKGQYNEMESPKQANFDWDYHGVVSCISKKTLNLASQLTLKLKNPKKVMYATWWSQAAWQVQLEYDLSRPKENPDLWYMAAESCNFLSFSF